MLILTLNSTAWMCYQLHSQNLLQDFLFHICNSYTCNNTHIYTHMDPQTHSWSLNNMGLNCIGALKGIFFFFFFNKYCCTPWWNPGMWKPQTGRAMFAMCVSANVGAHDRSWNQSLTDIEKWLYSLIQWVKNSLKNVMLCIWIWIFFSLYIGNI